MNVAAAEPEDAPADLAPRLMSIRLVSGATPLPPDLPKG